MISENNKTIFDAMTTEELCQILRNDAERTDGSQMDAAQLLQIMEVLRSRGEQKNTDVDPKKSIEIFKNYYLADDVPPPAPVQKPKRWKHGLAAAVAVLAILTAGLTIPDTSSHDVLQNIVKWDDDYFWFEGPQSNSTALNSFPPDTGERVVWKELRQLLTDHGITSVPLPNWMPEGYTLREVKVTGKSYYLAIHSSYTKGDDLIAFDVGVYHPEAVGGYSKNPGDVDLYQYNGIDFYIIENLRWRTAAWIQDGYECSLSGPLTMEEMLQMIHSMTKG